MRKGERLLGQVEDRLRSLLRMVPGFPRPGITFVDITTLLVHGSAWREAVAALVELAGPLGPVEAVVSPEARGFVVGAALAHELGVGFVPVRKPGKLPAATARISYQLEYGQGVLEVHRDAIRPGMRVLVADDLIATGGTARAAGQLVEGLGAQVAGAVFLIELRPLNGREHLAPWPVRALISLDVG